MLTKAEALGIVRWAYGPELAESLAHRLPDWIDLDNAANVELLFRLGLSQDRLFSALGGEP